MKILGAPSLVHHFLETSAAVYPDKVALVHEGVRATYAQINLQANQIASWLQKHGLNEGDRIAMILNNGLEYVLSYYGALKAGGVVCSLNTDLKPGGLRPLLQRLAPKVIISSSNFERLLAATEINDLGVEHVILHSTIGHLKPKLLSVATWDDLVKESSDSSLHFCTNPALNDSAPAAIVFTSGSTGQPKGVLLTHKNIIANTRSICESLDLSNTDRQLVVLPFSYVMGKSLLNTHFAVGGSVVIHTKFAFTASVLQTMVTENITGFSGVPSTYAYLLHRSPLANYKDRLPALRYCSQAGGHMASFLTEKLLEILPRHTQLYVMYGATEASARLSCYPVGLHKDKIGSIGKPIPGVTLAIVDNEGRILGPGAAGEVVAAGDNIMHGYWNAPEETCNVLKNGWYHTGDSGHRDKDGFYFVVGRKDSLMKVGGHRINPQEIEDVMMQSDLIVESIVIGKEDPLLGNSLLAMAVPKSEECTERQLLDYCASQLPRFKLPSKTLFVRALPKRNGGKIDRMKCIELLTQA